MLLAGLSGPWPATAAESRYSVGYRLEYSDNLRLSETNKESGFVSIPNVTYDFQHRSADWDADMLVDLRYEDYRSNTFGDRWTGVADGALRWHIVPERFTWVATDYFRQVVISTIQPNNPLNQQIVNTFSTGPNLKFRLTPVDELQAEYRFADVYEDLTNNDSVRNSAAVRLLHRRSAIATISLNYEYGDVDFVDPQNIDFTRNDYFLRYRSAGARTDWLLDLGITRIDRLDAPGLDGDLIRATATYRLSRLSSATLTLQDLLIESGYITATRGTLADLAATAGNFVSTDIYRERLADLSYSKQGRNVILSTSVYGLSRNYTRNFIQDRRLVGFNLQLDYDISAVVRLTLQGTYQNINYTGLKRRDKDSFVSFRYQHRLGTTFYVGGELRQLVRDSDAPGASYVENRIVASVSYRK